MKGSTATLYFGYSNVWDIGLGGLGEQRVEGAAGSGQDLQDDDAHMAGDTGT